MIKEEGTRGPHEPPAEHILWLAAADSAEVYRFTIDGFLLGVTLTPATAGTTEYNCALPRQIVGLTGRAVAVLTNCGEFLRVRPVS